MRGGRWFMNIIPSSNALCPGDLLTRLDDREINHRNGEKTRVDDIINHRNREQNKPKQEYCSTLVLEISSYNKIVILY